MKTTSQEEVASSQKVTLLDPLLFGFRCPKPLWIKDLQMTPGRIELPLPG